MKNFASTRRRGFTLIELLAVITIIVILAALVLGGAKYAKEKQQRAQAQVQVALLSKAIEEYKLDNGAYPPSTNPQGLNETKELRKLLYLNGEGDSTKYKIFLHELEPNTKQGWISGSGDTATIVDPYGSEYRYRTGTSALNPDFDLWSVGKDGKSDGDNPKAKESLDDIRN